jgi:hypothetical protein
MRIYKLYIFLLILFIFIINKDLFAKKTYSPPFKICEITISEETTNIYSKPDKKSSVITKIYNGHCLLVLSEQDNWITVLSPTLKEGYILKENIEMMDIKALGIGVINDPAKYALLYSGPGKYYESETIYKGQKFIILTCNYGSDWSDVIMLDGTKGCIYRDRVKFLFPSEN